MCNKIFFVTKSTFGNNIEYIATKYFVGKSLLHCSHVMVGNGDKLRITYLGDKYIGRNLRLKDVFVVPNLKKNLIYVSKFVKDNACSLKFIDEGFIVKDKRTKTILEKGNMRHNMYTLEGNLHESLTATKAEKNSDSIWHQ